jgi:flagellar protein FlaG
LAAHFRRNLETMSTTPQQPQVNLVQTPDYRESYANSVQVRVSVWDFQLVFGRASSESPEQVTIHNHDAIYVSPQQAKALWNVLGQNLAQYEQAFGKLSLEPQSNSFQPGPIN